MMTKPTRNDLVAAWRELSTMGTPPSPELSAKVLPEWSVGIDEWQDRLVNVYLRDHCVAGEDGSRGHSHFKLVVADYGGGKTHFLHAFRRRAIAEGFAVCYLQCKQEVTFDDWMSLYSMIAGSIRLPDREGQGIANVLDAAADEIEGRVAKANAPNPDAARECLFKDLEWREYPSSTFLQVTVNALRLKHLREDPQLYRAAVTWLQDGQTKSQANDLKRLGVAKLPAKQLATLGREMFYSLVKFITEFCGAKGLVLLMDEMDMMFNVRGRALERLLAALRTTIDQSDDRMDNVPVFGLFAAVPRIEEQMQQNYAALYQRFNVIVPFHQGNDNAAQIHLEHLAEPRRLLTAIGAKLVKLAETALDTKFDHDVQKKNVSALVAVAEERVANVDSRRLFVKTWCALLDEQARLGERIYARDSLNQAFQGTYQGIRKADQSSEEDDG